MTCVCVVGMHRSGTSALTRVLNLLGVYLGERDAMMEAHAKDNPTGYWEMRRLEEVHRRVLADVGIDDVSAEPLPENWMRGPGAQAAMAEIRRVVEEVFVPRQLWGFKDPRAAILLPLWKQVLGELGIDVRYVVVARDPRHVAASLGRRTGAADTRIYQFAWHYSMLCALSHTRGAKRAFVSYRELLTDWRSALRRAIHDAELPLSVDANPEAGRAIDEFLQPSLERSAGIATEGWAAPFVEESFDLISRISSAGESKEYDARIQELLEDYVAVARSFLPPYAARMRRLESDVRTLEATKAENVLLHEQLDAIRDSLSWRLTAPLRAALGILKGGR